LQNVQDVQDWFLTSCVCANVDDSEVRKKLLLEKGLTFEKAAAVLLEEEKALKTSKRLSQGVGAEMCATSTYRGGRSRQAQQGQSQGNNPGGQAQRGRGRSHSRGQGANRGRSQSRGGQKCFNCGYSGHSYTDSSCPAKGKPCDKCKKLGHFAKMCKLRVQNTEASESEVGSFGIGSLCVNSAVVPLDLVKVLVKGPNQSSVEVEALPDTGANVSAFPEKILPELKVRKCELAKEIRRPVAANGMPLETVGALPCTVKLGDLESRVDAFIIKDLKKPILSMQVLKDLHLIPSGFPFEQVSSVEGEAAVLSQTKVELGCGPELDTIASKFPSVFDGRCKVMSGPQCHIELTSNAVPVNTGASRSVPQPYLPALRRELDLLIEPKSHR